MPRMFATLLACFLASVAVAEENDDPSSLSPDKKWAYRLVEEEPAIVRAETGEVVLKLGDSSFMVPNSGEVLWAPDSRRVALNYRAGTRYRACAVYELAGEKWKALPDLETKATKVVEMIARAEQQQRKRQGATKSAYRRRIDDTWKVRRWIDADTFEASASSEATVVVKEDSDLGSLDTTVLFTVKCDNRGGWRVIGLHEASTAELEKLNAAE
jgi:hypothetical protein